LLCIRTHLETRCQILELCNVNFEELDSLGCEARGKFVP
jgi:hypothetical protein